MKFWGGPGLRWAVLATVSFTDLVGSTRTASTRGDRRWLDVLDDHDQVVRRTVDQHLGRIIKSTGDGFLATFDSPARAVHAGIAILSVVRRLGLEARAGVHTGEIELRGDDIGGIAVHIGARIAELAQPNQVLASRVVAELAIGSQIMFRDRGSDELRGVPGTWQLFNAEGS